MNDDYKPYHDYKPCHVDHGALLAGFIARGYPDMFINALAAAYAKEHARQTVADCEAYLREWAAETSGGGLDG